MSPQRRLVIKIKLTSEYLCNKNASTIVEDLGFPLPLADQRTPTAWIVRMATKTTLKKELMDVGYKASIRSLINVKGNQSYSKLPLTVCKRIEN